MSGARNVREYLAGHGYVVLDDGTGGHSFVREAGDGTARRITGPWPTPEVAFQHGLRVIVSAGIEALAAKEGAK